MKLLLKELYACSEAVEWAGERTIEEIVRDCHRGDWLLWLAKKIGIDLKPITKAKALCALTVRHLMKDERSIKACEVALKFADGLATKDELNTAASAAAAASADAAAAAAADAADAAAYTAAAYTADAADALKENQLQTANICREVLGDLIIEKVNEILNK